MPKLNVIAAVGLLLLLPGPARAQEKADQAPLPAICTAGAMGGMDMGTMPPGASSGKASSGMAMPMDEAHQALMAGMDKMQADMTTAMQAPDIDVAFMCGMIPHHQAAIAMARAELKYGKDAQTRKLAEAIVKAQEQEVTEMLDWLARKAK